MALHPSVRQSYAGVLGVPVDATAEDLRRAWRTWAFLLHPDRGGDAAEFARVRAAYLALLEAATEDRRTRRPRRVAPGAADQHVPPVVRPTLRAVLSRPRAPWLLALAALLAVVGAVLPAFAGLTISTVVPAVVGSAALVVVVPRLCLQPGADAAHRGALASVAWIVATAVQIGLSAMAGASLLPLLPLLALPLVAYTSVVLFPGWR